MKQLQPILSRVRRAAEDYGMIRAGDKIAVGVSAGKDSLTLLAAMAALRRFYPEPFELSAITIDMGFDGMDLSPIRRFCEEIDVPYFVVKTNIAEIIFDIRKEPNPCSLCAKMRRGSLHDEAKRIGANKVALGHHLDDVAETFMLNLFFEGRIGAFSPVTYLSRADLTLIRPLIYAKERDIASYAAAVKLPVIKSPCKADGNTERERMKELLHAFDREHSGVYHRIIGALQRSGIDGYVEPDKQRRYRKGSSEEDVSV